MKLVVLDGYTLNPGDLTWDKLRSIGELKVFDRTAYDLSGIEDIVKHVGDAEIVFTNKTPLPSEAINRMPNLKYIGVLATGYNVVDISAARQKNIVVTNIPTYGTAAVSQMTMALLLEVCHHAGAHSDSVKRGDWSSNPDWCYWNYPLIELAGKNIGTIGFGKIGQAVGRIAQVFGMNVLAFDEYKLKELEGPTLQYVCLDELFSRSDVISLHCPLFDSTKGIINKTNIGKMKKGVVILNTSRGGLVVEADLAEALAEGTVAAAALDVVSSEPIRADNPLLKQPNCIITPHIAWAPVESRQRLMDIAFENLKSYLDGYPINVVSK